MSARDATNDLAGTDAAGNMELAELADRRYTLAERGPLIDMERIFFQPLGRFNQDRCGVT